MFVCCRSIKTNKHSFPTLGFTDIGQSHVAWHVLSISVLGGWCSIETTNNYISCISVKTI